MSDTERRPGRKPRKREFWHASLLLNEEHRQELERIADREGGTLSFAARRALTAGLAVLEGEKA
jgi:hypothetical protein